MKFKHCKMFNRAERTTLFLADESIIKLAKIFNIPTHKGRECLDFHRIGTPVINSFSVVFCECRVHVGISLIKG